MKGLPYGDKSPEKSWTSGHPAHTCQASPLASDNHSSAFFHWDAAARHLDSKQAFTTLCYGTGSTPGLATHLVTTENSGTAFS